MWTNQSFIFTRETIKFSSVYLMVTLTFKSVKRVNRQTWLDAFRLKPIDWSSMNLLSISTETIAFITPWTDNLQSVICFKADVLINNYQANITAVDIRSLLSRPSAAAAGESSNGKKTKARIIFRVHRSKHEMILGPFTYSCLFRCICIWLSERNMQ